MVSRKKRIDLAKFDSEWSESYILVKTDGYDKVIAFRTEVDAIREKTRVKNLTPENTAELLKDLVSKMVTYISERFVDGMIFDGDDNKTRRMKSEDISSFDVEVVSYILKGMFGEITKKN